MTGIGRRALLIAAVTMLAAGCGINNDDQPRDIGLGSRQELRVGSDRTAGQGTGSTRIYLISPTESGQARTLRTVQRDIDETATNVLSELMLGPNDNELASRFRTAIPLGTQLLDARLQGGVLTVDVSGELQQLTGEVLIDAVAQIVFTASELTGVSSVRILIEGRTQQWPAGNGELQSEPLTRFDFPGLVATSQPAFPAVPSPPADG